MDLSPPFYSQIPNIGIQNISTRFSRASFREELDERQIYTLIRRGGSVESPARHEVFLIVARRRHCPTVGIFIVSQKLHPAGFYEASYELLGRHIADERHVRFSPRPILHLQLGRIRLRKLNTPRESTAWPQQRYITGAAVPRFVRGYT